MYCLLIREDICFCFYADPVSGRDTLPFRSLFCKISDFLSLRFANLILCCILPE